MAECRSFIAGDGSLLREILHPGKQPLDIRYSLAHAILGPSQKSIPHVLKHAEVYHILCGNGMMHIDSETQEVGTSDTIYIPPGHIQFIENTAREDLTFLCIVDPAWEPEIESVSESDKIDE